VEYLETEDEMVLQNEIFIIGFNLFEKDQHFVKGEIS
jgi:hypothetical protein